MSAELLTTLQSGPDTAPPISAATGAAIGEQVETPQIPDVLSILPLRGFVILPGTVAPLNVRRTASIKLLDETLPQSKVIGLVAQREESKEEPQPQDLYEVGCAAIVLKLLRQADDHVIAIVQGLRRFALRKIVLTHPYLRAQIALLDSIQPPDSKEWQAAFRNLRDSAARLLELTPDAPDQASLIVRSIENPEQLVDFLAPNLNVDVAQKQAILEELDVEKRLRAVQTHVSSQLEIAQIQQKLQKDVQSQFSDAQRRAYLREQVKAIQRELGEGDPGVDEQREQLRARLDANSCGSVWVAFATKRRFVAIAAPTSVRCRAESFRNCDARVHAIPFSCWMKSTRSELIFAVTRQARCSKCSIRDRTTRSSIVIWTYRSTSHRSFSSRPRIT